MMDIGSARLGMIVADRFRRKMKMTMHHEADGQEQRAFHIRHRLADGLRTVEQDVQLHRRRDLLAELRQQFFDVVHDLRRCSRPAGAGWPARWRGVCCYTSAATLSFCTLSSTLPSCCSRTGLPLRYATIIGRNAAAFSSWPLACTVNA